MPKSTPFSFFLKLSKAIKKYREKTTSNEGHSTSASQPPFIRVDDQDESEARDAHLSTTLRQQPFDHCIAGGVEDNPSVSEAQLALRSHDITVSIRTSSSCITSEHASIDGGGGESRDVQSRAGDRDNLGLLVSTGVPLPFASPSSANRDDRSVQRGEGPSMSMFKGASNLTIDGNAHVYEVQGNSEINRSTDVYEWKKYQLITSLPRAQAGLEDYDTKEKIGPCFPGTRTALLQEMMNWITDSGGSRMYVLSGLAGIGKSAITYSIASQANNCGLLGASFFFSWDGLDCSSAKKFFSTIAYQLCLFNEEFSEAISSALAMESGSNAIFGSPREQLEALILCPLRTIATPNIPRTLIVVDALDKCNDDDAVLILMGLCQLVQALPSFKVILSSRPQSLLDNAFTTQEGYKIFHLHNIEDKIINDDIWVYLKHCLSQEQVREQLKNLREDWCASDSQIESLVHISGKLFIVASMAVRFILDEVSCDPAFRIEELLRAFSQHHTPFDHLHEFYTSILRRAVPPATRLMEEYCQADYRDAHLVERYQAVVGTIVLVPVPLSVHTLAALIGMRVTQVSVVLRQLQSIILIGSDNIPIIYHQSFIDFITDSERCEDIQLRISRTIRHTWITMRCFEIMDKHLKYNILGLGILAQFMSNEEWLAENKISDEQLQEMIPPELQFACVHWADHFNAANSEDDDLMRKFQQFGSVHMLHWFETLSLIGKLDSAHRAIGIALKVETPLNLHQLLTDGLQFISEFYESIKRSALHTYSSPLTSTPTNSVLYQCYWNEQYGKVIGVPDK